LSALRQHRGTHRQGASPTVDVCDDPAGPADDVVVVVVVVVVTDARLVASDGAGRLDPPHQPHGGQGIQHVYTVRRDTSGRPVRAAP